MSRIAFSTTEFSITQSNGTYTTPFLVSLPSGNSGAVFGQITSGGLSYYIHLMDPNGNPSLGPDRSLGAGTGLDGFALSSSGYVAAAFEDDYPGIQGNGSITFYTTIYDLSGNVHATVSFPYNFNYTNTYSDGASIAAISSTSFVETINDPGSGIYIRRFDTGGNSLGSSFLSTQTRAYDTRVVADGSGGFAVAYAYASSGSVQGRVAFQHFDANGNPVGESPNLVVSGTLENNAVAITRLSNGNFAVSMESTAHGGILGQIYTPDGLGGSPVWRVDSDYGSGNPYGQTPALLALPNGFVEAWSSYDPNTGFSSIKAQLFDNSGNKMGGQVLVNQFAGATEHTPQMTLLTDGRVLIAWSGDTYTGKGIDGRIFAIGNGMVARDFDGNSDSDILLRNSAGITYLYGMNNATVATAGTTDTQVSPVWQIKGLGDFDGNGTTDILWVYNNTANPGDPLNNISYITLQNGASASSSNVVQQLPPQWEVAGVGDFDGDGKSDVLYRNTNTGQTYIDFMNGTTVGASSGFTSDTVDNQNWQVAAVGDFNGDGKADILWRYDNPSNPSDGLNGVVYEWTMNGTTVTSENLLSQQPGSDHWTVAGTGDFDGNGTADVLFRYENVANSSDSLNGFTYIDFMNGATVSSGAPTQWQIDNSWTIASIGDYNGDGKSDLLFQQAATGNLYIWNMNGAATIAGNFTSSQPGSSDWVVQNGVLTN